MGWEQPRHLLQAQSRASGWVGREGEAADGQGGGWGRDAESALKPKVSLESARKRKM